MHENNTRATKRTGKIPQMRFSRENMDPSADPLTDFYTYANGSWLKKNPVPKSKGIHGSFSILYDINQMRIRKILESCMDEKRNRSPQEKLCGDFYASVMNTEKIERLKFTPAGPFFRRIGSIKSLDDLWDTAGFLEASGILTFFGGSRGLIPRKSMPDKKNSSIYAFYLSQGGLSLPDRDYYVNPKLASILEDYGKHIIRMFTIQGMSRKKARDSAAIIMSIEKELAEASRKRSDLRDEEKNYNRVPVGDLIRKYSKVNFARYLKSMGLPKVDYIIVGQPEFIDAVDGVVSRRKISDMKVYMKWKVINYLAPFLHSDAANENFRFFKKKLLGQERKDPRWKLGVSVVDSTLGEALGSLYVKKYFPPEAKRKIEDMVNDIRGVFKERLEGLQWMSESTKKLALEKFSRFRVKIGYPDHFRNYGKIQIKRDDLVGNIIRSAKLETKRQMSRVGKEVDRDEWMMSPPTVNAYFNPTGNEIVFPAGILQPPFFDPDADDALNYGGIGGVIAHEITHGFDDQGRQYDQDGNLKNWWTDKDMKEFKRLAKSVVDHYSEHEPIPGFHVNGELTLGENIADLGAVRIAFEALRRHLGRHPGSMVKVDGFTPEQRFFLSWANIWRANIREPEAKRRITVDPHSPARIRGSVPILNHPEFEEVFNVKRSKRDKVGIW